MQLKLLYQSIPLRSSKATAKKQQRRSKEEAKKKQRSSKAQ
uniref:Uncharacterized protein n=1 Tax=viral metagenome TaxID=1070528 RepID=A0A6C0IAA9_9ZZZZ